MPSENPQPTFARIRRTGRSMVDTMNIDDILCTQISADAPDFGGTRLSDTAPQTLNSRTTPLLGGLKRPSASGAPGGGAPSSKRPALCTAGQGGHGEMPPLELAPCGPGFPSKSLRDGTGAVLPSPPTDSVSPPTRGSAPTTCADDSTISAATRLSRGQNLSRESGCRCADGCAAVRQNDRYGLHFRCAGCEQSVDTLRCRDCGEVSLVSADRHKATCACLRRQHAIVGGDPAPPRLRIL